MSQCWTAIAEPQFPWERAALEYVRERFPDQDPFRAWSNFEFIAEDGSINEVDLLVVSLYKIYLVEIKSRPGRVSGDTGTWIWANEGRTFTDDNPLLLANRKAKKLKSLLQHQNAIRGSRVPYIEPLIFLSAPGLRCELTGAARHGICLRQDSAGEGFPDIVSVLSGVTDTTARGGGSLSQRIDRRLAQALARALDQAGIRLSSHARRVGDYQLGRLLMESDAYQDWEAIHVSFPKVTCRVRLYPHARQSTALSRSQQRQAAEREFLWLQGVNHAGILRAEAFIEHEYGPALIFEHDAEAERLDLFLRKRGAQLDIGMRLGLVRQIAEALQYAHERCLYHQALSPQTILVKAPASRAPQVKIFDWQTARRERSSTGSTDPTGDAGLHLGLFGDAQSLLYMAPEAIAGRAFDAPKLDIFALGAVAYYVFSGFAPASSIEELQRKCAEGRGLRISEVIDGAAQALQELIQFSTAPTVEDRLDSVRDFLERLEGVEDELTEPAPEDVVHPLEARVNDRLEGGFVVKKRLGSGSTSIALLVERDGKEGVLKVALEPTQNVRLIEEGHILHKLRHPNIVELYEQIEISGHAVLLMAVAGVDIKAGAYTLAQRLRSEGRLSLDLLQRFGEELLMVTDWLEQNGISHRDIKPDNIGVGRTPSGKLTLILFDFSLANTPVDNIRAGTPPYLDPFLRRRKPPRWDLYAERFAVAMTLHEMATGALPSWGDGRSDPAMLDCEVSLAGEQFDPAVREELTAFFSRALRSDHRQRFDNAEEMLRAWRRIFESVDRPATETDYDGAVDFDRVLATATEETPLSSLGLSPRVLDALGRIGAQTVGELLSLPRIRLYRNQGLGQKIVKEIRGLAERIAQIFAERGEPLPPATLDESEQEEMRSDPRLLSVDFLARRVVPKWAEVEDRRIISGLLGLEGDWQRGIWLAEPDVAERLACPRPTVQHAMRRVREYWGRQPWMTALREDLAAVLEKNGGVMTVDELSAAVLAARGSAADGPARFRSAAAVAYATIETEMLREGARYTLYRGQQGAFVVATANLATYYMAAPAARAHYAESLGTKADELAKADPLLTPTRVGEELQAVSSPEGDPLLTPDRILRLAVAAARTAALSSRLELYPRGMEAARTVKLGAGSLVGPKALAVQQIQQRIASRYPHAEPIPGRPLLDDLLRDAGIDLDWDDAAFDGQGGYRHRSITPEPSPTGSTLTRLSTASQPGALMPPEAEAALALEERLSRAVQERRFLILTVAPRYLLRAEGEIMRRFPVLRTSLEALLIQEMKSSAAALGAKWEVVVKADAAAPESTDWRRLQTLVRQAMPAVERTLFSADRPVLLVYPGLLARYDQLPVLEKLRDACARGADAPGFIILMPSDEQRHMPVLDGKPIPVILASEWARIPEAWLVNAHRAQKSTDIGNEASNVGS